GPAHRDPPPAERQRSLLVAVPLRRPLRIMLALRADDLVDLQLHQLMHNAEPDADAEGEQPFPRCPDQLAERLLDLRRQHPLGRRRGRDDRRPGYLPHGGSSSLEWTSATQNAAHGSGRGRRDRRSNFYEISDNLRHPPTPGQAAPALTPGRRVTPPFLAGIAVRNV